MKNKQECFKRVRGLSNNVRLGKKFNSTSFKLSSRNHPSSNSSMSASTSSKLQCMKYKKIVWKSKMVSPASKKIQSNKESFDKCNSIDAKQVTKNLTTKNSPLNHQPKQPRQNLQKNSNTRNKQYMIETWPTASLCLADGERKTYEPQSKLNKNLLASKSKNSLKLMSSTPSVDEKRFHSNPNSN